MDKKSKNPLIISIIALALVLIGVTYAYFSARITGLESASTISLTAGRMGIVYSEDDASVIVNNIYPREEEWLTKTVTLTGTNTTDLDMKYDLYLNITTNTFIRGDLSVSLTGSGSNGTRIADIEEKRILRSSGLFKLGTGIFAQSNGDTHVYTLKIYFKDNGKDQNYNQDAVFNAKIYVEEHGANIAKTPVDTSNQNHNGKHCYTNGYVQGVTPADDTEYINGQYTYRYNQYRRSDWVTNTNQHGWGVILTDKDSTDPVTTELCAYIDELPLVNMDYMFLNSKATSIDFSSFDTSNVTSFFFTFYGTTTLTLDLSTFDTSNAINMGQMFGYSNATTINVSSFDTSNVTSMGSMFYFIKGTSLDLSNFDTSSVTAMGGMFLNSRITSLNISSFDTSNVTNMNSMFSGSWILSLDLSNFDTSNVTDMYSMFYNTHATTLDISSFDTSQVTNMYQMFASSDVLSLDLSHFDTSNVTNMSYMFSQADATTLDVSNFDTSKVTDMNHMFYTCKATSIDLSSFDTSNVTNMMYMFAQSRFNVLDLSSFNMSAASAAGNTNYMLQTTSARTGYARTQADADILNNWITQKPNGLTFVVK